jgi:hypothetical protein
MTTITRNNMVPRGIWMHKNLFQVVVVVVVRIGRTLGNNKKKKESTAVVVVVPSVLLQLQLAIVIAR